MPITAEERLGVESLLITEVENIPVLVQLAKSVTRNVCDIASAQEALEYVCIHVDDAATLLHKRAITKEILFKYLHRRKVAISADFTKTTLVQKVLEHWRQNDPAANNTQPNSQDTIDARLIANEEEEQLTQSTDDTTVAQYPINLLARKFSEWFFDNYNRANLKIEDFWSDAQLLLRIVANNDVSENSCMGADAVIYSLMQSKEKFSFYFNPNLTHSGVQGRMNVHGLVLVLACGTLHISEKCVGVFECTFGLLRDPFAENNWKAKTVQCVLRSENAAHTPRLCESDTLRAAMELPVPQGEFT